MRRTIFLATGLSLVGTLALQPVSAQPVAPVQHLRGTIEKLDGNTLQVATRNGAHATVMLSDGFKVAGVTTAKLADIKPGSYIGSAAAPQPDGTLKALEVLVFPPSMKGSGEGNYGWDLTATSTMTNGTVGDLVGSNGRTMTVNYGDSEKKIVVPSDVPVVAIEPSDRNKLVPGAHVILAPKKAADGTLTAAAVTVGLDGTVPPM